LSKDYGNFFVLLFYGLEILSKKFRKSWNIFVKKRYRHLKSEILVNSISYYFVFFILLACLTSFLSISPIQTFEKILKIFVVPYYTDYTFYQISIC